MKTDQKIHQWRKFLSNSKDKSLLIKFIAEEWQNERHRERLAGKTIFVTTEDYCNEVSSIGMTTREELWSTQEEADTRVFLHGPHAAAAGYRAVVITSDDIDAGICSRFYFLKASSHVQCLSNTVNRLEQYTWMCQESFECWAQNCVDLSLVSTSSLAATVSLLFRERATGNNFEAC